MSVTPDPLRIAVVGGGIGGLAAALSVARSGHRVTLVERAVRFGEIGAGLQLAPNASLALERLGVLPAVRRAAVAPPRLVMMDALTGDQVTSLDLRSAAYTERFTHPYLVTHRTDLHAALLAACQEHPAVTLRTGHTVTHVEQDASGARLHFAESHPVLAADAVVAADGLHSRLRQALVGDGKPVCSRYVAFRGALPTRKMTGRMSQHAASQAVMVWAGPRMHLVQYPVRRGELYNQVAVFESDHYTPESDDWGTEAELEERFAGACRTVRDALPLVSRDRRWPLYDRLPVDDWVHGRIVLLGDAAHPMLQYLAQGACQALEDAVALGEALGRFGEPTEAFGAYAAQRTARAARVQTNARRFGEICHLEGMGATFRNLFLGAREPDDFDDISWVWTPAEPAVPAR
ncbi:FAD-dependent monooxygenase [Streptomyces sp. NBC_01218]|uniref:FAD-dependent monooxygenase n=1 Tax=unclassified Streptomyces TaxID=2593676 RepID=UPI0023B8B8FF|nr:MULTISPECIES: FAD-dependent monooxygenase [unclassified Streptomyces]WEH38300.1 FAD-dependent monooxygenase [Streptomyces sp. AM 2-1-1]WSQ49965.1 FAD-dependent monooxygenase [Streptomyces sp. NBC_01218]